MKKILALFIGLLSTVSAFSQIDEDQAGAWYMYFFNGKFGESKFGFQGDIQYRNWNLAGDLEQLLLRGGLTFQPANSGAVFTLGYGNIASGVMGDDDTNSLEHRIYQEVLLPHNPLKRIFLTHRYRYEQRFVENQDFRTRYRYSLFMNVPLNKEKVEKQALYFAFYNELFINGQRDIGNGNKVEIFDRNRTYFGLGYGISEKLRMQAGWMSQNTENWSKGQFQLSLHHRIF
ncbi:MAG: DUF2490 domain-containing protein [Mariniphaga sp.]|jgi:hypothetical protein|nr:DUF2490 domain-containing protein [Mariniphaga sp.]